MLMLGPLSFNCLLACLSPRLLCLVPFFLKLNVFIMIKLLQHLVPIGKVDLELICCLLVTPDRITLYLVLVALVGGLQHFKTLWWSDTASALL